MRILRIRVDGLSLYSNPIDISFIATQRVERSHLNTVSNLFGNIYVNSAEAFIGINASGKTTALNVISFASAFLNAVPLNANYVPKIMPNERAVTIDIDFFIENKIYHLKSEIVNQLLDDGLSKAKIISEKLWAKSATNKVNKTNVLNFDGIEPVRVRTESDEYLSDDVSIMIAINKKISNKRMFVDLGMFTNFNLYIPDGGTVPTEIITLLDHTIEYITVENINNKFSARLKFFEQKELILNSPDELNIYLSSGTVKGVRVFTDAIQVLKKGGYLIIDEIENHFNRELVVSLLRLFMNKKTNPKGAVVIFSTHYPELLDEIERNDAVFITRSENGLKVDNLNSLLKRNDMKKSEVYQSNFLGGTAPKYKALMNLQKSIVANLEV